MRLRVTKVDEYQFLTCVKHEIWGSNSARFSDWQVGDYLVILVDKYVAGLAVISGKSFVSQSKVWDNGLFPNRIPVKFKYLFDKEHGPQILGNIREAFVNAWTTRYGWGILNQNLIEDPNAEIIIKEIKARPSQLEAITTNLESLLIEAKTKRDTSPKKNEKTKGKRGRPKKLDLQTELPIAEIVKHEPEELTPKEESLHSKAQYLLSKLGQIVGCKNFIASNDRKRKFNQTELGQFSVTSLPNLGLNDEATNRISLIDVIWLKQNAPMCAFEVETSTSVYSGLLRMSDLLAVVPALNIKLYIVAQSERQKKVLSELSMPTFRKIGLNDYCEFISIEDLEELLKKVENLSGHIQPSILDTIALGLEEEIHEDDK
ncbi:MAG: hypothetical protein Q8M08_12595 [Bacteroidales bacterium]|nr:hypothetical protein [Bacteroidales bacterium]